MKVRINIKGPGLVITQMRSGVEWQISDADECRCYGSARDVNNAIDKARREYAKLHIPFAEVSVVHVIKHGNELDA
jgi:hypothetical protein